MKSLARMRKEEEEKRLRKAERERKKKEREEEKRKLKKIAHKKKLRQKQNRRYYLKHQGKAVEERKRNGDELAFFTILLTKNRQRIDRIGVARWKTDAYKIYNNAIEDNNKNVKFPLKFRDRDDTCRSTPVKYEILLIKKGGENEETVARFRNEQGKFVDNVIVDKEQHVIIAKSEWLIEETFNVYGYHPVKDRKTYDFILNDIILHELNINQEIRTIMTYRNKLLINYIDDFDFVTCRSSREAQRLYMALERDVPKKYKKTVIFLGEVAKNRTGIILDKMMEKTGWPRIACKKVTS